ncbi:hypothetical protein D9758_010891 [Tetrapyrgos nigripes]|uniref:Uncharacterized protein n=1 Tax=Tetrapyrgos nigripes TaxID=182062 RepID=A0A8H5CVX4_9AGAR|nr:hypothetical protein D9758_010891 [Tetrapyrgos nigripes]
MSTGLRNQSFGDGSSSLKYSGLWQRGTWGESGTVQITIEPFATASFTFPVPANAFYYYGMKRPDGAKYVVYIDGPIPCDPRSPNALPIDAFDPSANVFSNDPPVLIFSYEFKDFAVHDITLMNLEDPRGLLMIRLWNWTGLKSKYRHQRPLLSHLSCLSFLKPLQKHRRRPIHPLSLLLPPLLLQHPPLPHLRLLVATVLSIHPLSPPSPSTASATISDRSPPLGAIQVGGAVLIFSHEFKDFAVHDITLMNLEDPRGPFNDSAVELDRFEIQVQTTATASEPSSLSFVSEISPETSTSSHPPTFAFSTTTSFSPASSPSASANITSAPSPSTASATISDRSPPLGAIVGGAVGDLAFLILSTLGVYFLCHFDLEPFISPIGVPVASPVERGPQRANSKETTAISAVSNPQTNTDDLPPSSQLQLQVAPIEVLPQPLESNHPRIRREIDGGPFVYEESERRTVVLPPEYDRVFGNASDDNENGGEVEKIGVLEETSRAAPALLYKDP